jgi:hypothetical protein
VLPASRGRLRQALPIGTVHWQRRALPDCGDFRIVHHRLQHGLLCSSMASLSRDPAKHQLTWRTYTTAFTAVHACARSGLPSKCSALDVSQSSVAPFAARERWHWLEDMTAVAWAQLQRCGWPAVVLTTASDFQTYPVHWRRCQGTQHSGVRLYLQPLQVGAAYTAVHFVPFRQAAAVPDP